MTKAEVTAYLKAAVERWRVADQAWRELPKLAEPPYAKEVWQEMNLARDSVRFCRDAAEDLK